MGRKIRDNLGTALLAIVLALIVWVNATWENDQPEIRALEQIPILVLNAPEGLQAVNEPITSVAMDVRAFKSSWNTLTKDHLNVTADWGGLSEGSHTLNLVWHSSDPMTTILAVRPRQQSVVLERVKREARDVVVELRDVETVPLGYRAGTPEIMPPLGSVEGPASAVDRVARVVVSLSLKNQSETVESILEPRPVDEAGEPVGGVKVYPTTVTVRVAIERRQNYREVGIRARTVGQPPRGYFISSISVEPATVMLVGPPAIIETMGGVVETKGEVSITSATRLIREFLELNLPSGVSVVGTQEAQTFTVRIEVAIDAVTGGTTIELPLKTKRLQEGLVARPSIPSVDVIITGPAVLLDEITTDLLDAYVDLAGLGIGVHQVRPRVDILVGQDSPLRALVVSDTSPQVVEVTIGEPPTPTPEPTATPTVTPTAAATPTVAPTPTVLGLAGQATAVASAPATETVTLSRTPEQATPTP